MIGTFLFAPAQVRTTLRNPAQWLLDWFGGAKTTSGEKIDEKSALSVVTAYACVRVIAESISTLPLFVYRTKRGGRKEEARTSPLWKKFHDSPNNLMTKVVWEETLLGHLLTWGNCFSWIQRDGKGLPHMFWPMQPNLVTIEKTVSGDIRYIHKKGQEGEAKIVPRDVFHVPGLGFDGLVGYSPVKMLKESLGLAKAQEKMASSLFGNMSRPSGYFSTPKSLDEDEGKRLLADLKSTYGGGAGQQNKVGILEEGIKFDKISFAPEESQFLESRRFQTEEIARTFRVPLHLIQNLDNASLRNIEHQSIDFVVHTLRPWLVKLEQEFNRKAMPAGMFVEHQVDGLLRGDSITRHKVWGMARQNGYMSANDVLMKENQNPIGPQGDIYMVPRNFANAKSLLPGAQPDPAAKPPPADDDTQKGADPAQKADPAQVANAHLPLMAEAFRRCGKIEQDKLKRAAGKDGFSEWLEEFYREHALAMREAVRPIVAAICARTSAASDYGPYDAMADDIVRDRIIRRGQAIEPYVSLAKTQRRRTIQDCYIFAPERYFEDAQEVIAQMMADIGEPAHAS